MAPNRSVQYVDFGYNTAREWWAEVALPAYVRFQEQGNRQTAIDASLHAWHVHEWLWHEQHPGSDTQGNPAYLAFRSEIIEQCPEIAWVRDVANASKHRGLGRPGEVTGVHNARKIKLRAGNMRLRVYGTRLAATVGPALELTDGTIKPLAEVLKTVVDYWNGRLP